MSVPARFHYGNRLLQFRNFQFTNPPWVVAFRVRDFGLVLEEWRQKRRSEQSIEGFDPGSE